MPQPSRTRENMQAAQKGPAARRRPRAAREAYSLYVERAAEGANAADIRRGASPPFRYLPPGFVAPAKPALGSGTLPRGRQVTGRRSHRRAMGVPVRARASPAQPIPGGSLRRGPPRPPPIERRRWALIIALGILDDDPAWLVAEPGGGHRDRVRGRKGGRLVRPLGRSHAVAVQKIPD